VDFADVAVDAFKFLVFDPDACSDVVSGTCAFEFAMWLPLAKIIRVLRGIRYADEVFDATKGLDEFVDLGSGGQLIRQADIDGLTIRVKSGHGYRTGHGSTDITSVLARDQVDSALAADLATRVQSGAGITRAGEGFSTFQTVVGDHVVEYRAVFVPATGAYEIPTYYIP
jgi:hypothetical protein